MEKERGRKQSGGRLPFDGIRTIRRIEYISALEGKAEKGTRHPSLRQLLLLEYTHQRTRYLSQCVGLAAVYRKYHRREFDPHAACGRLAGKIAHTLASSQNACSWLKGG